MNLRLPLGPHKVQTMGDSKVSAVRNRIWLALAWPLQRACKKAPKCSQTFAKSAWKRRKFLNLAQVAGAIR